MFGVPYTQVIGKDTINKKELAKKKAAEAKVKRLEQAAAKTKAAIAKAGKSNAGKSNGGKSADCKTCCGGKLAQVDGECMEEDMMFAQVNAETEVGLDEIEEMLQDLEVDELAQIADILE